MAEVKRETQMSGWYIRDLNPGTGGGKQAGEENGNGLWFMTRLSIPVQGKKTMVSQDKSNEKYKTISFY